MDIRKKLFMSRPQLEKNGAITIVAFGDSLTHGALASGEINYDTVYWNLLRRKINEISNYVPVNVINSGVGGTTAKTSAARVDTQVLLHNPDMVIVCFGLNDVNSPLSDYIDGLTEIFKKCLDFGTELIFMTPNMLNTYVAEDTAPEHIKYAYKMAEIQNSGVMDEYIDAARKLCRKMGVPVCDCYAKWKELSLTEDTTMLLSNRINHPTKEMHELFAGALFEMIFPSAERNTAVESTMYNDK